MAKQIQLRRGTTTEHNTFTGAVGEVTVDTTNKTLVVHDGTTVGGTVLAKVSEVPSLIPQATEAVVGKAKIATTAIAQEGVNDTDIITAKKLRDAFNAEGNAPIGACRAFLTGMGGSQPIIYSSLNIASISKKSAGIYVINYSTIFPTGSATVIANANKSDGVSLIPSCYVSTATYCELRFYLGGTLTDPNLIHVGVFI